MTGSGRLTAEEDEPDLVAMAMRMHDVQFERANRLQGQLDQIRDLTDSVHGHGADTLEAEMWRLRTLLNRIEAAISQPASDAGSWLCICGARVGNTGDEIHAHAKEAHSE